jgi:hypothetical protein
VELEYCVQGKGTLQLSSVLGLDLSAHFTRWDGNVKLECTTDHEPTGWDDQAWMWRSSGARRQGLPANAFKIDKRLCLGIFHSGCLSEDVVMNKTVFNRPNKPVIYNMTFHESSGGRKSWVRIIPV